MTRDEKVVKIAKYLAVNGWSTIYSYVDDNLDESYLLDDEEDEEDK